MKSRGGGGRGAEAEDHLARKVLALHIVSPATREQQHFSTIAFEYAYDNSSTWLHNGKKREVPKANKSGSHPIDKRNWVIEVKVNTSPSCCFSKSVNR